MNEKSTKPSLWQAQLGGTGLVPELADAAMSRAMAIACAEISLPPLVLPPRSSKSRRWLTVRTAYSAAIAGVLAAAFAVWVQRPSEPDLRPKGGNALKVYVEHDGTASILNPGTVAATGDNIRVQILPVVNGFGYWLVVGGKGQALVTREFVADGALSLRPGVPAEFAGSLKLTGTSEGETVEVIVCAGDALTGSELVSLIGRVPGSEALPLRCSVSRQILRR